MSAAGCVPLQSAVPLLIVSPDDQDHSSLRHILKRHYQLHNASGRQDAVSFVRRYRPKVVICEQVLADGSWRDLLVDLQAEQDPPQLIVSSRVADNRLWAEVLNLGGYDLLMKPFSAPEVSHVVMMAARYGSNAGGNSPA